MTKTEVYSWRLSPRLKDELERAARREGTSVAALLERISENWLEEFRRLDTEYEREQERIRRQAMRFVGSIEGDDPHRSERVRELVRERLARAHARTQRTR